MSNARDAVEIPIKFHPARFMSRGRSKLASSSAFYFSYAFHYPHKMFDDHSIRLAIIIQGASNDSSRAITVMGEPSRNDT
jgi:hypothetical protein